LVPYLVCTVLFVGSAAPAPAQSNVWVGGGGVPDWSNGGNWVTGVAPLSGATNNLLFAGTSQLNTSQNIANPFDLNALTFDTSAGAFVINSNALRFVVNGTTAPSLALNNNTPITVTFNNPVTFNATGTIGGTGTASLVFGPLTVGAGTLTVNRNNVTAGTLTVANGATIAPASPASTIGTLNVGSGGASITGTYAAELSGTTSDRLAISGPLTLLAGSTLVLAGTPTAGTVYTLASYTQVNGTFTTVTGLPPGYTLAYNPTSLQLVPEPALILALCAAGAGVVGWRRRESRSRPEAIA
jgi:hypothetical protein